MTRGQSLARSSSRDSSCCNQARLTHHPPLHSCCIQPTSTCRISLFRSEFLKARANSRCSCVKRDAMRRIEVAAMPVPDVEASSAKPGAPIPRGEGGGHRREREGVSGATRTRGCSEVDRVRGSADWRGGAGEAEWAAFTLTRHTPPPSTSFSKQTHQRSSQ